MSNADRVEIIYDALLPRADPLQRRAITTDIHS